VGDGRWRNRRSVWEIATVPFHGAHFAAFPPELARICVLAGSRPGDTVLDIFHGSGTSGEVSTSLGRNFLGLELNEAYVRLSEQHRKTTIGMPL